MTRTLRINGDSEKPIVTISLDDHKKEFDLSEDINAEGIYAILDYKRGSRYKVEPGENGSIDKTAFEAFCGLLDSIAKKTNEYADEIEDTEDAPAE